MSRSRATYIERERRFNKTTDKILAHLSIILGYMHTHLSETGLWQNLAINYVKEVTGMRTNV